MLVLFLTFINEINDIKNYIKLKHEQSIKGITLFIILSGS